MTSPDSIKTREEFAHHILRLADETEFENSDVRVFIRALAAWFEDCDGYYRNTGQAVNVDHPTWKLFADALAAARVYE